MGPGRKLAVVFASAILLVVINPVVSAVERTEEAQEFDALRNEGRYPEAILLLKRRIASLQAEGKLETILGAVVLNNLGELYYKTGRYAEAVPLYERAIAISEKEKAGNPLSAVTYRNLGIVYQLTKRPQEALNAYSRSIAILQKIPNTEVQLASTLNNLATLYQETNRFADAERLLTQVLGIYQKRFGQNHQYVATAYNNLGQLYQERGDLARAEAATTTANQIINQIYNKDHPQRITMLRNLGRLYGARNDWARAVPLMREALAIAQKQAARGGVTREGEAAGSAIDPALQRDIAGSLINAAMKLTLANPSQGVPLVREVLLAGQWRPSQAATSLLQMSARRLKGDGPLESLVRQRQNLIGEWQAVEKRLTDAALKGGAASGTTRTDVARLDELDKTITTLDETLAKQFPEYSEFTHPSPLDVEAIQALLRDDEALVLFIETGSTSWVWVITKQDKNLSLLNLSSERLAEETAGLRCGLDLSNWTDPSRWPTDTPAAERAKQMQQRNYERCRKLGKLGETGLPPFDVGRAYNLYKAFFGASEKAIAGKHLIIVPSASLMQFPFAALVTYLPQQGSILPRDLKWLGTTFPVSILPSVSSLSALRRVAKPSQATKPFLGVGNPLLTGRASSGEHRQLAAEARAKQKCAGPVRIAAGGTRAILSAGHLLPANAFQGSLADVAVLKAQVPLPETADELCEVAQSLQAGAEDVLLGDRATETVLKDMSNAGRLEQYRILHIATHGLVSGDLPGVAEPSLILTPPGAATEQDDGLLTASEIAQLKLDANWVVLSACNTAAGGSEGAEALSGLARAFFYAGARSVLVTHWEINSIAAVKLTTGAFSALQRQPGLSQAEAMRQAMAALVRDDGVADAAHPAVWAAFALVGDGWRR